MNKYIFTFGSGQLYQGFYQPIFAENGNIARAKMIELHGIKWSHQYNEDEWKSFMLDMRDYGEVERPLEPVYCK